MLSREAIQAAMSQTVVPAAQAQDAQGKEDAKQALNAVAGIVLENKVYAWCMHCIPK